jgi:hypothetical protein
MSKDKGNEFCNLCGRSVAWGSGWFVNRVPDLNDPREREERGVPSPDGDWICAECDAWCVDCESARRGR